MVTLSQGYIVVSHDANLLAENGGHIYISKKLGNTLFGKAEHGQEKGEDNSSHNTFN